MPSRALKRPTRGTDVPPLEQADVIAAEKSGKTGKAEKSGGKFPSKVGARRGHGRKRAGGT
jgi:hypothetical protein